MAVFTVRRDYIHVIGYIWMPNHVLCAGRYPLTDYDVANMTDEDTGEISRDDIEQWLGTHAGDFSHVVDFYASIGTEEYEWASRDSELTYNDCMNPGEE